MRRKSFNRSILASLLGLLIAVPAVVLTVASPARADGDHCCQVSIDSMPGQFPAGGEFTPFTLHVVNQIQDTIRDLNVSFVFQASGLVGDLVHLQRQRATGDPHNVGTFTQRGVHAGAVIANDQIDLGDPALPPGGGMTIEYQLSFSKKMPSAGLALSVQVQPRRGNAISSAGPYQSMIVGVGQSIPTSPDPTPTPSATLGDPPTATAAGTAPADQSSLVGGGSSSAGRGSVMWLAYTIGALLLLAGIGVIGTLVWRRGPRGGEAEWDEHRPSTGHTAPTALFPVAHDPFADPYPTRVAPDRGQ